MADAFFGLHSKEVGSGKEGRNEGRGDGRGRSGRRRRNFLFAFFCPISCRWPPNPALAAGRFLARLALRRLPPSSTLSESNTPMPTVRREGEAARRRAAQVGATHKFGGKCGREWEWEEESEWRKSRAAAAAKRKRGERRGGQCKNLPRSRAVKCRNGPTLLGGARSRLPCMPSADCHHSLHILQYYVEYSFGKGVFGLLASEEVGSLKQCFNPTCQTLVSFSFSPSPPSPASLSRALTHTHTRPGYTRSRRTGDGRAGGRRAGAGGRAG